MLITLELVTKGFVSSFEEEEYELTKVFNKETDEETDDGERDNTNAQSHPEEEREIFEDDTDYEFIREYF